MTSRSLGNDSFFIIGVDKNFNNDFERCAFIFFAGGRVRGSLTNCGRTYIRQLPVAKPSATAARVTIPTADTGRAYRWVAFSYWTGRPARCSDLCFDAAPNRPPPILHDLIPPVVTMPTTPLRIWNTSDAATFDFPFSLSDQHAGVKSWSVQSAPIGTSAWTIEAAGAGGGPQNPSVTTSGPGHFTFRVTAMDKQGNATAKSRMVLVPTDVADPGGPGTFTGGATTPVVGAYGESLVALDDATDAYQLQYTHPGGSCREFDVIGPGTGDWVVHAESAELHMSGSLEAVSFDPAQRQTLFQWGPICEGEDFTITFTVMSGSGFAIDAVLI